VRERAAIAFLALAACTAGPYEPCPVVAAGSLPPDAFGRCRAVIQSMYGPLAVADAERFLLQSEWAPVAEPVGERRASVFRDDAHDGDLAVVVELRRLTTPWLGLPEWSTARGDSPAERDLAAALRAALQPPR
jgi:hypothetical protein